MGPNMIILMNKWTIIGPISGSEQSITLQEMMKQSTGDDEQIIGDDEQIILCCYCL